MIEQTPILFLGDSPSLVGGLSRIGRHIACVVAGMEEFRVGFLGRGGVQSRRLPFTQYTYPANEQWGEDYLEGVWDDFAGEETGIIMPIWDPSRLLWFTNPVGLPRKLELFLKSRRFKRWAYLPIDHVGPGGLMNTTDKEVVSHIDRPLAYGQWGAGVIETSIGRKVDWLPHGINLDTFNPRDYKAARMALGIRRDAIVVGCVMTNQERKDWGLAFETLAILKEAIPKVYGWFKVDSLDRYWDFQRLVSDYKLENSVTIDISSDLDEVMAYKYSTCDVTFLPSLGEGFGYPIVESLACGVPCIHGDYAGGTELVPKPEWIVKPVSFRVETRHNCLRPVYNPIDWANALLAVLSTPRDKVVVDECIESVKHLDWPVLNVQWKKWFREGLEVKK